MHTTHTRRYTYVLIEPPIGECRQNKLNIVNAEEMNLKNQLLVQMFHNVYEYTFRILMRGIMFVKQLSYPPDYGTRTIICIHEELGANLIIIINNLAPNSRLNGMQSARCKRISNIYSTRRVPGRKTRQFRTHL